MVGVGTNGHNGHDASWHARAESVRPAPLGQSMLAEIRAPRPRRRASTPGVQVRATGEEIAAALGFDLAPAMGTESLVDLYRQNGWARAAINAKAHGIAQLPFPVYDRDPREDGARVLEQHPLTKLLANPNPLFTRAEFFASHVKAYLLDGEGYWFLAKANGEPVGGNAELYRITEAPALVFLVRGSAVEVKTNDLGFPIAYRYKTSSGKPVTFPAHAVVPFVDHDPKDMLRGVGDGEAAFDTAALMYRAERFLDARLQHGGDPGCWITYNERVGVDELERRKAVLDQEAETESSGTYTVLDQTAKVTPKPTTIALADVPALLNHGRDSILAFFGVPGPVVGIYDNATYNNIGTSHREFWGGVNGVLALGRQIADVVRNRFLARLAGTAREWDGYPGFDSSGIAALKEQRGEQMEKSARTAVAGIGVSFNEAMRMQGVETELPELGDVKFVNPLLGRASSEEEIPSVGDAGPEEELDVALEDADSDGAGDGERGTLAVPSISRRAILSRRARRALTKKPDGVLERRVAAWFKRFGRAEAKHLRALAEGRRSYRSADHKRASVGLDAILKSGSHLTEADVRLLDMALAAWESALSKVAGSRIRAIFRASAAETAKDIGASILDVTSPRVLRKLAEHVAQLSEGVTSTLAQQVRTTILRVLAKDTGPEATLRELLQRNLPDLEGALAKAFATKEQRAMTIARTETSWARQNASFDQMRDAGVSMVEWVAEDDAATRPSHRVLDGMIVPLGQEFAPGLRYPMDPRGAPDDVINCRCALLAADFEGEAA